MRAGVIPVVTLLALAACSSDLRVEISVPSAREFESPVPLMVADVQIGSTGETGLGPDDRPMVVARVDREYRDRITRQTEFVLRRKAFGLGSRYIEVVPGDGAPVKPGHHFVARAGDPTSDLQARWQRFVDESGDPELRARVERLRAHFTEMVEATQETFERERPELETEARAILEKLREQSAAAASEFERWVDENLRETDRRVPK